MIQGLVTKVGLSQEQAEKVANFLQQNAHKVPEWLGKSGGFKEMGKNIPGL